MPNATLPTSTTAAGYLANVQTYIQSGKRVAIVDTAANISAVLGQLESYAGGIASIEVSDNAALSLTPAQLAADSFVLAMVVNANASQPLAYVVTGSLGSVEANAGALDAAGARIAQINVTGGAPLTLTATQVVSYSPFDAALAKGCAGGRFAVADASLYIASDLGVLAAQASEISSITSTNSAPLQLTAAKFAQDQAALALARNANGTPLVIDIADSSGNLALQMDAIEANLGQIASIVANNLSGNDDILRTGLAAFLDDRLALDRIVTEDATPRNVLLGVSDTAARISQNLDALDEALTSGSLRQIVVGDPADNIVLTARQFLDDGAAIATLAAGNPGVRFEISDTAAHIESDLVALARNGRASRLVALNVTDANPLVLSLDDVLASGVSPLLLAWRASSPTIDVVGEAADIAQNLGILAADGSCLNRIVISDNGALDLTAAQAADDGLAIDLLTNADSQAPVAVDIGDAAANISRDFAALASLSVNGANPISSISVLDAEDVTLSIDDLLLHAALAREIQGAPALDIFDAAANIAAALPTLLADIRMIGSITISDGDDLLLSAAQQSTYAAVLAKLQPANSVITLPVVGWSRFRANASSYESLSTGFALSDTAADIAPHLQALNGVSDLAYIVVNGGALQLSATQVAYDSSAVSRLVTPAGGPAGFSVADSALNVAANLDALQAVASRISAIDVTDGAPLPGVLAAQVSRDAEALSRVNVKIDVVDSDDDVAACFGALAAHSSQIASIAVTGGTLQLSATELATGQRTLNALYAADNALQFSVSDGGAAIGAALNALQANLSHLGAVTISDFDEALNVTAHEFVADAGVIDLIEANNPGVTVAIVDSGANISKYLDQIGAASTIVISDNAPVNLTVTQLAADAKTIYTLANADDALPLQIDVTDTAAHFAAVQDLSQVPSGATLVVRDDANAILAQAQALQGESDLGAIDAAGGAAEIVRDAAGVLAIQPAQTTTHGFFIADASANISRNLDRIASVQDLARVVATDGKPFAVSIAQLTRDASTLALIEADSARARPLEIVDSFADAASASGLTALEKAAPFIGSMQLSGPATPFTAAEFTQYGAAVNAIGASEAIGVSDTMTAMIGVMPSLTADKQVRSLAIVDTAADIAASLDALNTELEAGSAGIGSVTISDNGPLTLTGAQLGDGLALEKLRNANGSAYQLDIAGAANDFVKLQGSGLLKTYASHIAAEWITASIAQAGAAVAVYEQTKTANPKLGGVVIADTASDLESAASALAPYSAALHLEATSPVVVDFADFTGYKALLDDVEGGFSLQDATAALGAGAAQIDAALGAIQGDIAHVDQLNLIGALTGVSAASALVDASVLQQVSGGFSIVDSAANIAARVVALCGAKDFAHVTSISVSSGGVAKVSVAQAIRGAAGLSKLEGGFDIADTGAQIQAKLGALASEVADIDSISLLSGAVHVSLATLSAQSSLLDKIAGGVVVTDSAAHIASALPQLESKIEAGRVCAIQLLAPAGSATTTFRTSAANAVSATCRAAIARIQGPYVLQLTNAHNAIQSQTGDAAGLVFADNGGTQTLTGGGSGETFDLAAAFGSATITDFAAHAAGASHDVIAFVDGTDYAALFNASNIGFGGGDTTITMGSNRLTLDGMSKSQFYAAMGAGDFEYLPASRN